MSTVLKALGALLAYPTRELVDALPEITAVIDAETGLDRDVRRDLRGLVAEIAAMDPIDLEERYVGLFDRGRATSLHLFEHVHGDSRDRGQAMVDLKAVYERAGFVLAPGELPDFLPAVLEFLAQRPFAEARDMLGDCAHIIRAVGEALRRHDGHYDAVMQALLSLIGVPGLADERGAAPSPEPALDDEWREEPVFFGPPGGQGCGGGAASPASVIRFTPRQC
jgi:nitrate reductase delta subunit